MNQAIIAEATKAIINTRDFCGNEKEAVRDVCADNGIKEWMPVYKAANFRANAEWNACKKAAGVDLKHRF